MTFIFHSEAVQKKLDFGLARSERLEGVLDRRESAKARIGRSIGTCAENRGIHQYRISSAIDERERGTPAPCVEHDARAREFNTISVKVEC